jgi:PAS domain S-box-containing protein
MKPFAGKSHVLSEHALAELRLCCRDDDSYTKMLAIVETEFRTTTEDFQHLADTVEHQPEWLLQQLLDKIPTPIIYKNAQGVYWGCNKALEDFNGSNRTEIVGKTLRELATAEQAERQERIDQMLLAKGGTQVYEDTVQDHSGAEHQMLVYRSTLNDAEGKVAGIVSVSFDVTAEYADSQRAEETSRLLNRIVSVLDNNNIMMFVWNAGDDWSAEYVSDNVAQYGYTAEEFLSGVVRYDMLIHPEDLESVENTLLDCSVEQKRQVQQEYRLVKKDGTVCWVRDITTILRDERGTVTGFESIVQDITEYIRVKHVQREMSEMFKNIVVSANDAILTIDEDHHIVLFNPAAEKIFACSATDAIGKRLEELMPLRFRSAHQQYVEGFGKTNHTTRKIGTNNPQRVGSAPCLFGLRSNGEEFPAEISIAHVATNGGKRLYTAIVRDITERVEAERAIQELNRSLEERVEERTRELREINEEKNEMLGIAAHDLKNPLTSIMTSADLLHLYVQRGSHDKVIQSANSITRASVQMLDIITKLLDVNRIESGMMSLSLVPVPVLVLEPLVEEYRARAAEKHISLHYAPMNSEWMVSVDEGAFAQVFENLLSNAIKYSPFGKRVWITAEILQAAEQIPEQWIRMSVQDEGPGIKADEMGNLFKKFSRLSTRPTAGEHSTGLGLSIVKRLVEAMNGRVRCESEQGKGCTFIVEFPLLR